MASFLPQTREIPPEIETARRCGCKPYPCRSFWDCSPDCAACQANGGPLYRDAETTWEETGEGLPAQTVEELAKLSQPHGPNSRKERENAKGVA